MKTEDYTTPVFQYKWPHKHHDCPNKHCTTFILDTHEFFLDLQC